jgi:hypothetical protein
MYSEMEGTAVNQGYCTSKTAVCYWSGICEKMWCCIVTITIRRIRLKSDASGNKSDVASMIFLTVFWYMKKSTGDKLATR